MDRERLEGSLRFSRRDVLRAALAAAAAVGLSKLASSKSQGLEKEPVVPEVTGLSTVSEDSGVRKPGKFLSDKEEMPTLESDKKEFIDVGFDREVLEGSTIGEARKRSWSATEFEENNPGFRLVTEEGSRSQTFYELLDKDGQNIEAFYLGIKPKGANLIGDTKVTIFTKQTNDETLYSSPWINSNDAIYKNLYPAVVTREENGQQLLLRARVDSSRHIVLSEPFFWRKLQDGYSVRMNVRKGRIEIFNSRGGDVVDEDAYEQLWRPVSEKIVKSNEIIGLSLEAIEQLSETQRGLLTLPVAVNKNGDKVEEAYLLSFDSHYQKKAHPIVGFNIKAGSIIYSPIKGEISVEKGIDSRTGKYLLVIKFFNTDKEEQAEPLFEIITNNSSELLISKDSFKVKLGLPLFKLGSSESVTSGCQFPVVMRKETDGVFTNNLDEIFLKDEKGKFVYLG